jgi:hypothetical protein
MADLSTVPQVVNLTGYGGDTLTVKIVVPAGVADGAQWDAQVRASRTSEVITSTFTVIEPATPGDPGWITLPSEETARLTGTAPVVQVRGLDGSLRAVQKFVGVWDCQVSNAGDDPVRTLVQGTITFETDVTRP